LRLLILPFLWNALPITAFPAASCARAAPVLLRRAFKRVVDREAQQVRVRKPELINAVAQNPGVAGVLAHYDNHPICLL